MTIKPLFDRILVKRLPENDCTPGGIYIPPSAKEKPTRATVCAVGPGALTDQGVLRPMSVKKGDQVLFGKYNGTEVQLDGEDYVILHESEVLAILDDQVPVQSESTDQSTNSAGQAPETVDQAS